MPVADDENLLVNALTPEEQMQLIEDWDRYDTDQSGAGACIDACLIPIPLHKPLHNASVPRKHRGVALVGNNARQASP